MNKIKFVKAEIERLKNELIQEKEKGYKSEFDEGRISAFEDMITFIDSLEEEPVSKDLEEACDEYYDETWDEHGGKAMVVDGCHDIWFPSQATDDFYKAGAQWQKEHLWKDAQGDDLPEIDKEVIALIEAFGHYKVIFAHRVDENAEIHTSIDGKPLILHPKKHDKGGWNIPNIKWWLDIELPKMEE